MKYYITILYLCLTSCLYAQNKLYVGLTGSLFEQYVNTEDNGGNIQHHTFLFSNLTNHGFYIGYMNKYAEFTLAYHQIAYTDKTMFLNTPPYPTRSLFYSHKEI